MTGFFPIILASFIHLVTNVSLFIHRDTGYCSEVPKIASYLFYLTLMELVYDYQVIPKHWTNLPYWGRFCIEAFVAIIIGEFGVLVIWYTVEAASTDLVTRFLVMFGLIKWRITLVTIVTLSISLVLSRMVALATDRYMKLTNAGDALVQTMFSCWNKCLQKNSHSIRSILKREMLESGVQSILRDTS